VWTDDVAQSTKMNKKVADAMGDAELADAIDEGIDAHRAGDIDTATNRFALAARLAREHGNEEALARVAAVVDIEDAATGRVRPKAKVDDLDLMILETRSTRTKGPRS
jgi:von Willebrand factor type A C-terminal domain